MENPVDLEPKIQPRQKRAKATYEKLLDVAARLLEVEGVERISTNMIADHAGVTVPALYRYFPNKYAVLRALGDRLMERQNEVMAGWLGSTEPVDVEVMLGTLEEAIARTVAVTLEQPGALAIMRALRAVPVLQEIRLSSHRMMTDAITDHLLAMRPQEAREDIWLKVRFSIEVGYATVEMAMEEDRVPHEAVVREAAAQLRTYWQPWFSGLLQK